MWLYGINRTLRKHKELLGDLRDAQAQLERSMKNLQLDADAMFDKTHRLFGRIAKRAAIDHPMPPIGDEIPRTESPQTDEIPAAIHARRAAGAKQ